MMVNGYTELSTTTLETESGNHNGVNYGGDPNQAAGISDEELLAIIIGCSVGTFVLILILILIILLCRRYKKRKSWDLACQDTDKLFETKSAPISRTSSPKLQKRKSCPDVSDFYQGLVIRSLTQDSIPDFVLPPERVQPQISEDRGESSTCQSHFGNLQPDLYRSFGGMDDDESLMLPPSEHGRLWFSVLYDGVVEQLNITLVKIKELPGRDRDNAPRDPFVKIFLLPDERTHLVSKVKKRTLAPVYNEAFVFEVSSDKIQEKVLRFSVYDVDRRRIRHSLGHVLVPLKDMDITKGDVIWKDLEPHSQVATTLGELSLSLCYIPSVDKIKVVILQARQMNEINTERDSGVYVRIQMTHGRKIYKTKKTIVQKLSPNPVFNESFSFSISGKILDTCSFNISVMTSPKSALGNDEIYGKIVIGSFMFSRGDDLLHWQDMLSQPRTPVTKWHALCPGNL